MSESENSAQVTVYDGKGAERIEVSVSEKGFACIMVKGDGAAAYVSAETENIMAGTLGRDNYPRFELEQNDDVGVVAQWWLIQPETITTRGPRMTIGLDVDDNPIMSIIGDKEECGVPE
jgi:hypothetical protein